MSLQIRLADKWDCEEVWCINSHQETRKWSFNQTLIPYEDHVIWFTKALTDPSRDLYVAACADGTRMLAGVGRLDYDEASCEISVAVQPEAYGKGVGTRLIDFMKEQVCNGRPIYAKMMPNNVASIKLFEKCGFKFLCESTENGHHLVEYKFTPGT